MWASKTPLVHQARGACPSACTRALMPRWEKSHQLLDILELALSP